MKKSRLLGAVCASTICLITLSVNAAIIDSSYVNVVTPPSDTIDLRNNINAFVFSEKNNYTLTINLSVNATLPGNYTGGDGSPPTEFIASGTTVDSYYFQTKPYPIGEEPAGVPLRTGAANYYGFLEFNTPILGIIFNQDELLVSTTVLGLTGTIYLDSPIESGGGVGEFSDLVSLSSDLRTLNFDFSTGSPTDNMRIITSSAIPIPPALWLFGSGLLGLIGVSRRRHS